MTKHRAYVSVDGASFWNKHSDGNRLSSPGSRLPVTPSSSTVCSLTSIIYNNILSAAVNQCLQTQEAFLRFRPQFYLLLTSSV